MKYIKKLAESYPYEYEDPPIGKVELWDFSRANENDDARKEAVCTVASISYGNEFCKDPDKLWNLLIERGHESPFEFVRDFFCLDNQSNLRNENIFYSKGKWIKKYIATFKLKIPIFVARQIQRHRSFSYIEMSRRYVKGDKVEFEFWTKENPYDVYIEIDREVFTVDLELITLGEFLELAEAVYKGLLKHGYKPEQARGNLPIEQYTQFFMQGDYRAWLNFFIQRLHPEAQEETRLVAQSMWNLLKEHQPEIVETMADYLNEWTHDCNPIFTSARKKKTEWFKKEFLGGE